MDVYFCVVLLLQMEEELCCQMYLLGHNFNNVL